MIFSIAREPDRRSAVAAAMQILEMFGFNATHTPMLAVIGRLVAAAFFGALIGIEREMKAHPAGFRTHMLTATAAAVFTLITFEIYHHMAALNPDIVRLDAIRVIEAVTAGVAFLAAGTIIRSGKDVKGLTSGAAMWMAGAIGVACGAGYFGIALVAVVLALLIIVVLKAVETRHVDERHRDRNTD